MYNVVKKIQLVHYIRAVLLDIARGRGATPKETRSHSESSCLPSSDSMPNLRAIIPSKRSDKAAKNKKNKSKIQFVSDGK
ncbi:hypothetical protein GCM10020331_038100 [Ectobacillus funiculus]